MIIDIHAHTFPDKLAPRVIPQLEKLSLTTAYTDGTVGGLQKSMAEASVDISVIQPVATSAAQVISCNDFAYELNCTHDNLISFGAMHPDFSDYKAELLRMKNLGLKGVKLHPNYQNCYFDDIRYKRIVDAATALDLIILIHAGIDIGLPEPTYATPQRIKSVVSEVKPEKLILAHMGSWCMWDEVLEVLAGSNVYLDTAFALDKINYSATTAADKQIYKTMSDEQFMKFVAAFGADRILFGTDSPWCGQLEFVNHIQNLPLSAVEKAQILGENARGLLQLP